jgi:sugar lactone lactonase YvrE
MQPGAVSLALGLLQVRDKFHVNETLDSLRLFTLRSVQFTMKTPIRKILLSGIALCSVSLGCLEARAAAGDLYVGGMSDNVVYKFTPAGARTVFASGVKADSLAFDAQGNLFASDNQNKLIVKITPDGTVSPFASGVNGEDFVPGGLAFDALGNLYAVNTSNGNIYKYTPAGARSLFASDSNGPFGLAFDTAGNLFVSEINSGSIVKFGSSGGSSTLFASGFTVPVGLAFDSTGILYEADFGTGRILKVSSSGTSTPFATSLVAPRQLAFDSSGNLFVSTAGNGEIIEIAPNGTQTIFASGIRVGGLAFEPVPATTKLANISTRALVQTGDQVVIGGFVVNGSVSKQVLVRAIGPSLPPAVPNRLQDPVISLHNTTAEIASNDDWATDPNAALIPTNLRPGDSRESAILITLQPGSYTAIVSGKGGTTGVGLVEVYDMDTAASASQLANISTRGLVQTGDFVMIGGFVANGTGNIQVLVRAIGPSLAGVGITNPLPDPTVRLFNGNGVVIASNDNWKDTQQTEIQATGNPPTNDLESAILINLAPGSYTAIVSDKNGASGIGLVEVFKQ